MPDLEPKNPAVPTDALPADPARDLQTPLMRMQMGPSHPATHGTVKMVLDLDGERVVKADIQVGYLHRGFEKECETGYYYQNIYGVNYRVKDKITMADLAFRVQHVIKTEVDVIQAQLSRNNVELIIGVAGFIDPHMHIESSALTLTEFARGRQRLRDQLIVRDNRIDPSAAQRGFRVNCFGLQGRAGRRDPHRKATYLERGHRERDADGKLGEADRPAGHQSHIGTHGQDTSARDRVPVDRGDHRRRVVENREKSLGQRGYEALGIVGAAVDEGAQIDTGRETPTGAGDDNGPLDTSHRGGDDLQQVQVESVHRRIVESDCRHAVGCIEVCHVSSTLSGAFGPNNRALSARMSTLRTLPVTVIGNSSTMST